MSYYSTSQQPSDIHVVKATHFALFTPLSREGKKWLHRACATTSAFWLADGLHVECDPVGSLSRAAAAAGLTVEESEMQHLDPNEVVTSLHVFRERRPT